jgi:hypothetical protein
MEYTSTLKVRVLWSLKVKEQPYGKAWQGNYWDPLPVCLGDLVVACLPLNPRFTGSILAKDDGFLRAMSFGREVKLGVPCHVACRSTFHS